jgi:hypothetical protein
MNGAPDVTRPPRPVRKLNFITDHDQEVQCATRSFVAGTAGSAQYLVTSWRRSLKQHSKL